MTVTVDVLEPTADSWDELADEGDDSHALVDVRDTREYDTGHLAGAVNVPTTEFRDPGSVTPGKLPDPDALAELLEPAGIHPGTTVYAYDGDRGVDAARLLVTLSVFGHSGDLVLLDGGLSAWRAVGTVVDEPPAVEPGTYRASDPDGSVVVDRETVEAIVDADAGDGGGDGAASPAAEAVTLVDTRTPTEYNHAHIPGAVNLGLEELLTEGRLKPVAEIERLLAEQGLERDQRIILYCNTARRLSYTFVVLSSLGYEDVLFYEGSLTDWIRQESPTWDPTGTADIVRAYAPEGNDAVRAALGEDAPGRLKLVGIYGTKHDGYYMLRTKVPGGQLTADQAQVIGEVADEYARAPPAYGGSQQNPVFGDAYLDITTRQDIQMHWIELSDIPDIWDRYESVGLTTMQACGNSVRNVVCCPADGLGEAAMATGDVAEEITDRFLRDEYYANMPRKFKVSVTGCHENCARGQINDLGLLPARKDGREGFQVLVGGGLSDGPRVASDLGVFVDREQVIPLVEAVADVFMQQGDYLGIAANRLRFLVEELGVDRFRAAVQKQLPFEFEPAGEALTTDYRGDHVGVHPQVDGNYYVGLNVPTGRMLATEFLDVVALSREYGGEAVRLTLNQNVLLAHVAPDDLEALRAEPVLERYSPDPGPFERGIVTCTGSEFCTYGLIETKTRGLRWARALDERLAASDRVDDEDLPDAFRVHMSGCSASCAQPQIADVGLRGERYRNDALEVPAADVGLGGDLASEEFIDWIVGSLPVETVPDAIERCILAYVEDRDAEESFADWVDTQSNARLQELLRPETVPAQPQAEVS